MTQPTPTVQQRSEGDINLTPGREEFHQRHLDDETRAVLEEDATWFFHQSLSTPCLNVLEHAEGSYLIDRQGRKILDFHGNSVHQLGHAHPKIVEAVKKQLDTLAFCPRRFTNEPAIELARRLATLAPVRKSDQPARVLFAPGGALANGMALKLVRYATGRFKTISMWESFHGGSLDALSIGGEAMFRAGAGPLLPGCIHVPPYQPEGVGQQSAEYVEYALEMEADVAAVFAEPMRWTTVVPPPAEYWKKIRAACDRHNALLVIDEIPSCLGRTGKMFCIEHFGIEPDILVIGKGLGGGIFPLSAMIARGDLNVAPLASIGHYTHEKSPVGCAAGLAVLDVIESEGLVERARTLGATAREQLDALRSETDLVSAVRGLGLQIGVELRRDGEKAVEETERIMYACLEEGLSYKVSGGNVLTLSPPLTLSDAELDEALDILRRVILRVAKC